MLNWDANKWKMYKSKIKKSKRKLRLLIDTTFWKKNFIKCKVWFQTSKKCTETWCNNHLYKLLKCQIYKRSRLHLCTNKIKEGQTQWTKYCLLVIYLKIVIQQLFIKYSVAIQISKKLDTSNKEESLSLNMITNMLLRTLKNRSENKDRLREYSDHSMFKSFLQISELIIII